MRRRRSIYKFRLISCVSLLVIGLFFVIWIASAVDKAAAYLWLGVMTLLLLGAIEAVRGFIIISRLSSLIPVNDGMICPKCRTILNRSSENACCPKCKRSYSPFVLREYWENFALAPKHAKRPEASASMSQFFKTRTFAISLYVVLALGFLFYVLCFDQSGITGSIRLTTWMIFGALNGIGFTFWGEVFKRVGDGLHCAKCGYQQTPASVTNNQPVDPEQRCPECGAYWNLPGGVVRGRRVLQRRQFWAGLIIHAFVVLIVIGGLWSSSTNSKWIYNHFPTGFLISDVVHAGGFTTGAWAELNARSLTPAQTVKLAQGLLDSRLRRNYLSPNAGAWLWQSVQNKVLPRPLVERYYREMFEARIEGPTSGKVGSTVKLWLDHRCCRSGLPAGINELVYVSGFKIGDDEQMLSRRNYPLRAPKLSGRTPQNMSPVDHSQYSISAEVQLEQPGPLHIELHLWFVVGVKSPRDITWSPDGVPSFPPGAFWTERRVIEHVVNVYE